MKYFHIYIYIYIYIYIHIVNKTVSTIFAKKKKIDCLQNISKIIIHSENTIREFSSIVDG